ncbi:MAG: selenide, water dikinase SelD [Planctomycetes bacterium]|nr:selenide, water dikinase SelD [Planctomycetota bacterium]
MQAQDLVQVLSKLPAQDDPRLLVSTSHFDDAGVARLTDEVALVQTVDFFPPVVDDPWWFGRIAAANALSDLYAMGARPFSVLNVLVFNTDALPLDVMTEILRGADDAVREAGAMTLGGHSVTDEGVKFGLACTGTVRPGEQITNGGARPGDVVFLTKPLGAGCLTTAAKKRKIDAEGLRPAIESMGALNAKAADAAREAGVLAATDVTGYGLAGHGHELASASGVDLHLYADALPWLPHALELGRRGLLSGGSARTKAHLGARYAVDADVPRVVSDLVADSETSGGLLLAVAEERAPRLAEALAARDVLVAAVGRAAAPASGAPRVLLHAGPLPPPDVSRAG